MKTFLGVLMVLSVSGDKENNTKGFVGGSVLLQCDCPDKKQGEDFRWQLENTPPTLVFLHKNTTSNFNSKYKGRAKIFVADNGSNCSLLLTNLTAADQGQYKGSFHGNDGYKYCLINLNISANKTDLEETPSNRIQSNDPIPRVPFPKVISMVLLLGFCLVLWCMLKLKN